MRRAVRRLSVCFAFAMCCFLLVWAELADGRGFYLARYNPLDTVLIPVLGGEALVAAGLFGAWELCRRRRWQGRLAVHFLFLLACVAPLGIGLMAALRLAPVNLAVLRLRWAWPFDVIVALGAVGTAIRNPRGASRFLLAAFRWSSPALALIMLWSSVLVFRNPRASFADGELQPPISRSDRGLPNTRVVWVIFDEMSQAIAFQNRPDSLKLPNFDRLKAESFYASAARPPFEETHVSIPALILGMRLSDTLGTRPGGLLVRTGGGWQEFADFTNVFDTARRLGFNTAVTGWYLPYGRLLNRSLVKCYWTSSWVTRGMMETVEPSLLAAIWRRWSWQVGRVPLIGRLLGAQPVPLRRRLRIQRYQSILSHARELAADPAMGLVLIHMPVPHPPAFYSRAGGVLAPDGAITYLDNMALADRTLGELRCAIEQAGLWDRTALLVSADHGWRRRYWSGGADWTKEEDEITSRVDTSAIPFLLKMPGQTSGAPYDKEFNTVVTRRIITEILSGDLRSPAQLAAAIGEATGESN